MSSCVYTKEQRVIRRNSGANITAIRKQQHTPLTPAEREEGLVEFHCDAHGFLCVSLPEASAWCQCGKRARTMRSGRLIDPVTLKPTEAKARVVNEAGFAFTHGCGVCRADFRGEYLLRLHRVGSKLHKRCLTADEMTRKGWATDDHGKWRNPKNNATLEALGTRSTA